MTKNKTLFILFLEGFVSVSLQILIIRQLIPFIGNSVVAMSMVISVFLSALALGYYKGGNVQKNHLENLFKNFMYAGFFIAIGFSYIFINSFFSISNTIININILEAFLYLMLFLFTPVYLLGQTIPILTNFVKENTVSKTAGLSLAINTIGSVLGSISTSLILLYYIGVAGTIMINCVILSLLMYLISVKDNKNTFFKFEKVLLTGLFLSISYGLNNIYENERFLLTNNYNNYEMVYLENNEKLLLLNKSFSSLNRDNIKGFDYIEYIKEVLFLHYEIKNKNVLVLGAGGFTMTMPNDFNNKFIYVDIDKDLKDFSEKYFLENKIPADFIADDARNYLRKSENKYDVIIVDAYTNRKSIPWHLITKEFMSLVSLKLNEDGFAVFNIIANKKFDSNDSRTIHNTITTSFDYCHSIPIMSKNDEYANIMYFCKNDLNKKKIYRDNFERNAVIELK